MTKEKDQEETEQYDWVMSVVTGNEVNGGLRIKEYDDFNAEEPSVDPVNVIEFTATKKKDSSVISMVDDTQEVNISNNKGKIESDRLDLTTHKSESIDNGVALSLMTTVLKEHFDQPGNGDEDTIAADPLANPYDPAENPILPDVALSQGEDDQDDEEFEMDGDGDGSAIDDYRPEGGYTEEEERDIKEDLESGDE